MRAVAFGLIACAAALLARLRRTSDRVARAEHEIRGPATAIALLAERMRREPALAEHADALEAQLDRLRAGLADLRTAREGGRRSPRAAAVDLSALARSAAAPWAGRLDFDWEGGVPEARTDRRSAAQALGNLLANAAEHGSGAIQLRGRRRGERVEIDIENGLRAQPAEAGAKRAPSGSAAAGPSRDGRRGRGLRIAVAAARDAGGRLRFQVEDGVAVARLELPADGLAGAA